MFKSRNLINLLTVICTSCIAFLLVELYFVLNKNDFSSFGWANNNITSQKIKKCKKMHQPKIGVFGDSFVEFYGNTDSNLVTLLQKELPTYDLCNFGLSGTHITSYIHRFNTALDSELEMKYAIFYLYETNDFIDHFYPENSLEYKEILNYDLYLGHYPKLKHPSIVKDRKLGLIRNFIKSTYTINIVYRYVFKRYFPPNPITEQYLINYYNENKFASTVELKEVLERFHDTPSENLVLFNAAIANTALYSTALLRPNYFNEIHSPSNKEFLRQKKITFHHINYIKNKCKKNDIGCFFFIIPTQIFVSRKEHNLYHDFFKYEKIDVFGISKIANSLISNYEYIYYPKNILNNEDFIKLDGHLKKSGNEKLAKFTKNILNTILE